MNLELDNLGRALPFLYNQDDSSFSEFSPLCPDSNNINTGFDVIYNGVKLHSVLYVVYDI